MITNEKFVEIAKGLLEKTRKQKVPWNVDPSAGIETVMTGPAQRYTAPPAVPTEFTLSLANSIVRLSFNSPLVSLDCVTLSLLDKNNHLAASWKVEEGDEHWPLAFELYEEVSKQVNKWDKVLEEVEAFIAAPVQPAIQRVGSVVAK